jgi:heterodisulfide reductase subunit B
MNTQPEVGITLVAGLLKAARGADVIVTVCPMCQMNLEAFQNSVSRSQHMDLHISVLYLPQLIGHAMGLPASDLGLGYNLALTEDWRHRVHASAS